MGSIEQRLQALENEIRRTRRWNRVLLLAVVVMIGVAGAPPPTPIQSKSEFQPPQAGQSPDPSRTDQPPPKSRSRLRTVEADQFVLLDRQGRSRMTMVVDDSGPALSLLDEQGRKRLELRQSRDTAGLNLLDVNQKVVASLQVHRESEWTQLEFTGPHGKAVMNSSSFRVKDRDEQSRLMMGLINGNYPVLGISQSGQTGSPSVEITAGDNGARGLSLHDAEGRSLISMHAAEDGSSFLELRHPAHERSLQISLRQHDIDGPRIDFFSPANPDGSGGILPILQMGLSKDHQPYIRILDPTGKPVFTAPAK